MSKWNRTQASISSKSVETATAAFHRLVESLPGEDRREAKSRRKAAREQLEAAAAATAAPAKRRKRKVESPQPGGVRGLAAMRQEISPQEILIEVQSTYVLPRCYESYRVAKTAMQFFSPREICQYRIAELRSFHWSYGRLRRHDQWRYWSEDDIAMLGYAEAVEGGSTLGLVVLGNTPKYQKYLVQSQKALAAWGREEQGEEEAYNNPAHALVHARGRGRKIRDVIITHPEGLKVEEEADMLRVFEHLGYIPTRQPAYATACYALDPSTYGEEQRENQDRVKALLRLLPKAMALLDLKGRNHCHIHAVTAALEVVSFAGEKGAELVEALQQNPLFTQRVRGIRSQGPERWHRQVEVIGNVFAGASPEAFPVLWRSRNGANADKAAEVTRLWSRVKAKGLTAACSLEELYVAASTPLAATRFQEEAFRWESEDSRVLEWEERWNSRCAEEERSIPRFAPLEEGGLRVEILHADDPRGLFLGHHVVCCQRPRSPGESCAWHGSLDRDGRFLTITSRNGITAQGWVWRGKECLVIDNIEASGGVENRLEALLSVVKKAVGQWGLPVRMGTGYMSHVNPDVYPVCADIEPPPQGCYSDARHNQVWIVRPEEVLDPTTETKTTEGLEAGMEVSPMVDGEQADLHAIAAQLYPEGWQFADLDGVVLVLRDGGAPVGYACLNPVERRVDDIAVLPTARRGVKTLTEAMFQVMGNHTWTAEARETTSLPMLRRMAQRGRIGLVVGGISHYVGGDACYEVSITPISPTTQPV